MLLILPIRSLLLYGAVGLSTYSMFVFLLTASPLELHFMWILMNLCSVGIGLYLVLNALYGIVCDFEKETSDCHNTYTAASTDDSLDDAATDSTLHYVEEDRVVEEKNGKLIMTITYAPLFPIPTKADECEEELREMVEKSPLEESPTEETTEFADLLEESLHKNTPAL
jgi:hypothetical protein